MYAHLHMYKETRLLAPFVFLSPTHACTHRQPRRQRTSCLEHLLAGIFYVAVDQLQLRFLSSTLNRCEWASAAWPLAVGPGLWSACVLSAWVRVLSWFGM